VVRTADGATILTTLTNRPLAGAVSTTIDSVALYDYQTPYPGDQIFNVMEIFSPPMPPVIVQEPAGYFPAFGSSASLSVSAGGPGPLSYSWRKDGKSLADGGNLSGTTTPILTLTNVSGANAGGYSVVVSNVYGTVTSQVAVLTVADPVITGEPLSVRTAIGGTAVFNVTAIGTLPLSYQWRKGGTNLPGATLASLTLTNLRASDSGSYTVTVTGPYGSATSLVASLTLPYYPAPDSFNPGAVGGYAESLAVQPDGKILTGGVFIQLGGQARLHIGRLNADGSLDSGFNPGAVVSNRTSAVNCLAVQPDGKILAGGVFTELAGQPCDSIGRLNADGTLDPDFNTRTTTNYFYLNCLAAQPDGKVLVGGGFPALRRLNADGTPDTNFNVSLGVSGTLYCAVLQPDGKILVGGTFTNLGGQARTNIGRLNPNGTVDTNFVAAATGGSGSGWNPGVITMVVQPDGKILVGGNFSVLDGRVHPGFGRLNANGSLDTNFTVQVLNIVHSLALQADGNILLGGQFVQLVVPGRPAVTALGIGCVNADGTLDTNFNPQVTPPYVVSLALQADGKLLLGGNFTQVAGQFRTNIARLYNTAPATNDLKYDGATITWLRGGTSSEVWRTTFDYSAEGTNWTSLGAGARILGGWQLVTNVPTPTTVSIRARGFVAGGHYNASGSFVQTIITVSPPAILTQPSSRTNNVGTEATFTVLAGGTPPLRYQWRKDGTNILDATNATLVLHAVDKANKGYYSVIVSSPFGSVTSASAFLDVNLPPVADASATKPVVISPNGIDATVILDGTRSSDPDGDLLRYTWYESGITSPLANGAVAVVTLPVGSHSLLLVVSDSLLEDTNAFSVEIITTAQAVERLMAQVDSLWPRSHPLLATLSAALASIQRGNTVSANNQLQAFQNKVRAQVASSAPALAEAFIQAAQEIIDALSPSNANPGVRPHGTFTAVSHQANGHVRMQFAAGPAPSLIVEASTDLVNWEMIGVAVANGDGTFTFEDPTASKFPKRYYRVVHP
jgi:uncharacterized delta-60 repeat protein